MPAPRPATEAARLAALEQLLVLDSPAEEAFDDLTRLAALVCEVPIAAVSLIDSERQWFKSKVGLEACETARDLAFCAHTILQHSMLEVPDATADPRFRDNPFVTGDAHVRFYAGVPLCTANGHNVGSLCVVDRVPRALTALQRDALTVLAKQVVAQLVLRQQRESTAFELRESETFRVLFEQSSDAHLIFDETDGIIDCNHATVAMLRCRDKNEVLRLHPAALSPEYQPCGRRSMEKCVEMDATARRAGHHRFDWTHRRADGEEFPCEVTLTPVELHGRSVLLVVWHDLTERARAEEAVRASEQKFRTTMDRLAEGVYLIDAATHAFVDANAAMLAMLGYTRAEFLTLAQPDVVAAESPEVIARTGAQMRAQLAAQGRADLGRRTFRRKDGTEVPVNVRVTHVPGPGADLHAVVVRDITEQVQYEDRLFEYQCELEAANAKLRALARTDGLTGANNRAAFNDRLSEAFDRSARYGHPLSVILMDVDHFKQFNDTFGHPAGDEVLQEVAALLRSTARGTDFVARYGGEEFAVVLPDTDYAGAMVLAERCRRAVAARSWDKRAVTLSAGVATTSPLTATASELVQQADDALYRSKAAGRNRVTHCTGTGSGTVPTAAAVRA